ncbi:DGQHR domain-containing protein [Dyella sp. OK004]|uniref:DGQHR domain-containing protein n=1 Tax=Dyella sp. OK004 TaxID=1855292 RepID=UPI0008EDEFF9|nr:DGQHR domain-containing protein [Dyella sp. OK004]SFS08511.1 DGQHR domain-containing protein [Dyella sp. OK004]
MATKSIKLDGLVVSQPIGEFYVVVMEPDQLTSLAVADVRKLDDNELDKYLGIQRRLDKKRVAEIKQYVKGIDATFPTSVLLHISAENAEWDDDSRKLTIFSNQDGDFSEIAHILDGQHRVAGLEGYSGPTFQLCVCIFIGADIADQASIFSTVNLAQTKVSKSLVYDLYEYQKARSPQKTSHNIAIVMDRREGSPYLGKIKRLGFATKPGQMLTQATVVEELMRLITRSETQDRQDLMKGKKLLPATDAELRKTPFRKMFIAGQDSNIALNVLNFFLAVEARWPTAWEGNKGVILPKTNGFKSLMWALGEWYSRNMVEGDEVFDAKVFGSYLQKVNLRDEDFTTDLFKPGSTGQATFKDYLREAL